MTPADRERLRLEVAALEAEASAALALAGDRGRVALLEADAAAAAGWRRSLHPWEDHAMFAGIEEETAGLARRVAEVLTQLRDQLGDAIVDLATAADTPTAVARSLLAAEANGLRSVPTFAAVLEEAEQQLRAILAEAAAQGAASAAPPSATTVADAILDRIVDDLDVAVIRATQTVATQAVDAAAEVAAAGGPDLPGRIRTALADLSDARLQDAANVAANNVYGAGRGAVPDEVPETPARIYASELRDGNTCGPCAQVDGREYDDLEEARRDYPAGRFRDCLGGPRCRGTLVFVWEAEAEPTLQAPGDR